MACSAWQVRRIVKMNKRFISFFLSLIFILCLVIISPVSADGAQFTVSGVAGNEGDEVVVSVLLSDNPGLATFKVRLNYDKSKLEPVSISQGAALTVGGITSNLQVEGIDVSALDYVTAYWYNTSNISANGVLFTVKFQIKEGAAGNIPLTLTYEPDDVSNQNGDNVPVTVQDGTVTVVNPNAPTFAVSASEPDEDGEFSAVVSMANNPGLATFKLRLYFDNTKIVPVSIAKGAALTVGDITSNIQIEDVDVSALDYVTAYWYNVTNITGNGAIFTVKFKVLPNTFGETALNLTYAVGDVSNQIGTDIDFVTTGAVVQFGEAPDYLVIVTGYDLVKDNNAITGGSVDYNIVNNSGDAKDVDAVIAIYADTGKMVYMARKSKELSLGSNEDSFTGINITNAASPKYTVKIFCWSNISIMEPLSDPAIFEFD